MLWGPANMKTATVFFGDGGSGDVTKPQFLAVTPAGNNQYRYDDCGGGLLLPPDHPWVLEFRRNVTAHASARVRVMARSLHSFVPVAGTEVSLRNGGQVFEGRTRGTQPLVLGPVGPGDYQVTATKPYFPQADEKQVSILPGSCAELSIPLGAISTMSGRIVDSRGAPLPHAPFHLTGHAAAQSTYESFIEFVRNRFFQLMGWARYDALLTESTRTDSDGRFVFTNLFPGLYYLESDIEEINETFKLPLPKTYYPGVHDWRRATPLVIEAGRSINNVLFRLPDFGEKRRVEIQVVSEDGLP